jgi:hypothetical protein
MEVIFFELFFTKGWTERPEPARSVLFDFLHIYNLICLATICKIIIMTYLSYRYNEYLKPSSFSNSR